MANLRASIAPTGQDARAAVIRDLSPEGAFVETTEVEPVGSRLILRVPLHDEFGGTQWLEGKVVRLVDLLDVRPDGTATVGIGVEFRLTASQREGLGRLVDGIVAVRRDGAPRLPTLPPGAIFVDHPAAPPSAVAAPTAAPKLVLVPRSTLPPAGQTPATPARKPALTPARLDTIEPTQRLPTIPPAAPIAAADELARRMTEFLPVAQRPPPGIEETVLRVDLLRCGQARSGRVRLFFVRGTERSRMPGTLDVRLYCLAPGRSYQLELHPDFGEHPPRLAAVRVWTDEGDGSPPLPIFRDGGAMDQELPLQLRPQAGRIALTVTTDGSSGWPAQLCGGIRLRVARPEDEPGQDTRRLAGSRSVAKVELAAALRASPVPALELLGRLMESQLLAEKIALLHDLADSTSDVRLLEAAVRDMRVSARLVPELGEIDFPSLSLADPADAAIVIFHPDSPEYLVAVCFTLCLERNLAPDRDRDSVWWRHLAKAGAVALWRRDRPALDDLAAAMKVSEDPLKATLLEKLIFWASRRSPTLPDAPREPLDGQVARIRAASPAVALATALEALVDHGFVDISRDLSPPGA
ncbi:MAG: PilZ domain-containing protein [Deltaproteobacteria bacterium]|nr:PilZ domain-containing protein [Deltaproteobacteria bacterium]